MTDRSPPAQPAAADGAAVFQSLFESYPDAVLVVDPTGRIVQANALAESLFGYEPEELLGMNVDDLVPTSIRSRHAGYREGYSKAPRRRPMGHQLDLSARRKDGSHVLVEIALSPLPSSDERPLVAAAIRAIEEYPRVQQALRRERYSEHLSRLARLAVDMPDAYELLETASEIAAMALGGDMALIVLLKSAGEDYQVAGGYNLMPEEVIGARVPHGGGTSLSWVLRHGAPLVVEDYTSETRFAVPPQYLEAGLRCALAVPFLERGRVVGGISVRFKRSRPLGPDEILFMESVASTVAARLQRAESEEALKHAQRLETVGQLTGGIAHDFNNILTIVQGNLQILQDGLASRGLADELDLADTAMRASRRGADLTAKLLAFSRRQMLQPALVDVPAMLRALASMLARTLGRQIRIAVSADEDCPSLMVDPGQLEAALLNLAINSRDAMPEGGTLTLGATLCHALPKRIRGLLEAGDAAREPFVAITVADTGTGMSPEVQEHAFEPFYTTKEAARGTGLGLSTVYGFVRQSHGAIDLQSEPGRGTTMTLYLPMARISTETSSARRAGLTPPKGLKTVLVEDDGDVRRVLIKFLESFGCIVQTASNAEDASAMLAPGPALVDLLVTDVVLGPGMRGTDLALQATRSRPGLPVVLLSGYSSALTEPEMGLPFEFVRKPCGKLELGEAIARALERS